MCDKAVDLRKIKTPSYFLSTIDDHIAPWPPPPRQSICSQGRSNLCLGASGHIVGVINPPAKKKRSYWINGKRDGDQSIGSVLRNPSRAVGGPIGATGSGNSRESRNKHARRLGNAKYSMIEPAPGHYVMKRL